MGKACICQICTCGRHRCPHRPRGIINRGDQPCMLSEYAKEFPKKPITVRAPFKPSQRANFGGDPMAKDTTNRLDYISHKMERPFVHQPEEYKPPQGNMDTMTSYKKEFIPHAGERTKPIRREDRKRLDAKFEGEPTYRSDYRKWSLPQRPDRAGGEVTWQPPTDKFAGDSTTKRDYIAHKCAPRESLKPEQGAKQSDEPFNDNTNYRNDYIKHPLHARVRDPEPWKAPKLPFEGLSTFKSDYGAKEGGKQASCKPDNAGYRSDAPFYGSTTNRTDFKTWPMERPFIHEPAQYSKPEGIMDLRSTTHTDFPMKQIERVMAMRPVNRRPKSATFQGTTTHHDDFRKWNLGDRPRPMMKADYIPPSAPFEGMSTFTAHYVPHKMDPVQSCRPDHGAMKSDQPFEGNTMYRTDYIPKKSDICPAAILDTGRSAYVFVDQADSGHKWYNKPTYETITDLQATTTTQAQLVIA